jgi:hypothetical protein
MRHNKVDLESGIPAIDAAARLNSYVAGYDNSAGLKSWFMRRCPDLCLKRDRS